jgi:hypothetical protein
MPVITPLVAVPVPIRFRAVLMGAGGAGTRMSTGPMIIQRRLVRRHLRPYARQSYAVPNPAI